MSLMSRHNQRMASSFSEVRQGARDELMMVIAGSTGVISVVSAITWVLVATISN